MPNLNNLYRTCPWVVLNKIPKIFKNFIINYFTLISWF